MVGIAYVRKRLYNPELLIDPNEIFGSSGHILRQTDPNGKYRPMYEIHWTGATQAGEELGTAATKIEDGTGTPFIVTVVSDNIADDRGTAAGAVHSVALIGITCDDDGVDGNGDYIAGSPTYATVEVVAMDGTTDVLATRLWLWLDAIYACEWGTGATDATGIITAESPANTNLLVLSATQNEGEGGVWHFPADHEVHTHHVTLTPTATFAAGDGLVLTGAWTSFDQPNNSDPDLNVDYYTYTSAGGSVQQSSGLDHISRKTTINSKVLWLETLIANSIVYDLHIILGMH